MLIRGRLLLCVPFSLCRRVTLSMGGGCWAFAAARDVGPSSPLVAGGVVTALCHGRVVSLSLSSMGWPAHRTWHEHLACLLSGVHHCPWAAN